MEIRLHVPTYEELLYREMLLADPQTMSYNRGYDIDSRNYDKSTGAIRFPRSEWKDWYEYFVGQKTERYYAYIECDGEFVGEVNLHKSKPERNVFDMGIVVEAKHRGKGIAKAALIKLLEVAFTEYGIDAVENEFEPTRHAALNLHKSAGFKVIETNGKIVKLMIDRSGYFSLYAIDR